MPKLGWLLPRLCLVAMMTMEMTTRAAAAAKKKPNIIFILADDAGWADFESNDDLMRTGNISRLKEDGVFLNQSYVLAMCSPSRAALLSGRYPHTFGLQHSVISANRKRWLNETFSLLPNEMQGLGYRTHMLGKWHMGYCHPKLTPLGRGFDTFYGFWLGSHTSYYNHTKGQNDIYDWRDQHTVDWSAKGVYQTDLLSDRAVEIVEDSDSTEPFFMYLAYGAPHGPFEVPQVYRDRHCSHVTNESRQIHCGMMAALDEGVGRLITALEDKGVYDDTAILFMSDNGGPTKSGSVNWPLRAGKKAVYEGGLRSYTVLKAPGMTETNITWPWMAHAIDWLPTLVTIGGGKKPDYSHGKNLWWKIKKNEPGPRTDMILTVDDFENLNHMAIRSDNMKLIGPVPGMAPDENWTPGFKVGWYPPYQLLDSGEEVWEDMKESFNSSTYLLYDIENDPEERFNLAEDPDYAASLSSMKNKLMRWVTGREATSTKAAIIPKWPLQPLDFADPTNGVNNIDGHLTTCWCDPPTFAGGDDCPP